MLLFYLRIPDPLFEDSCLSVNVELVIIDAEAKNEILVIVVENRVELLTLMPPI